MQRGKANNLQRQNSKKYKIDPAYSVCRWYYSPQHAACLEFTYSGCLGNSNNFITRTECEVSQAYPKYTRDIIQGVHFYSFSAVYLLIKSYKIYRHNSYIKILMGAITDIVTIASEGIAGDMLFLNLALINELFYNIFFFIRANFIFLPQFFFIFLCFFLLCNEKYVIVTLLSSYYCTFIMWSVSNRFSLVYFFRRGLVARSPPGASATASMAMLSEKESSCLPYICQKCYL